MAEFYIYNKDRERIGLLQNLISVQWLENYQSPGEIQIVARITDENMELLAEGHRIYNNDSNTVAVIRYIQINDDADVDQMTAKAVMSSRLLDDRVVMATLNVTDAEKGMYQAYSENQRNLPIKYFEAQGLGDAIETQISWGSVLEAVTTLAELSGLGYTVRFDPETRDEQFFVYQGTDRTESSDNYVGFFAREVGNIAEAELLYDNSDYKNVAVVAGEDSGTSRAVVIVSLGNFTGEERRELFVDARDLQKEYQVAKETGKDSGGNPTYEYEEKTYTDAEYNAILATRGLEKLNEHLIDFSLNCTIEQTAIKYREDYFLGDIMPLILPSYSLTASARISSVKKTYEYTGEKIEITLSEFSFG